MLPLQPTPPLFLIMPPGSRRGLGHWLALLAFFLVTGFLVAAFGPLAAHAAGGREAAPRLLARSGSGTVAAWGDNSYGQSTVPAGLSQVVAVSAGANHSLALKADGTVVAWGYNGYGQSSVPAGLSGVVAVSAGGFHSLALRSNGTVAAWGDNSSGQLNVPAGLSGVVTVSAGTYHSLALVAVGTPTANPQSVSVPFNAAKPITLTGTDPDVPTLPLTYAVVTGPAYGTLSGTAPNLIYTPAPGYHGVDSFTFTVSNGGSTSTAATVNLTVATGVPAANPESVTTSQNTPVGITLTGSDPDSPALALTYTVTANPAHGSLSGFNASTGTVTYTPTAAYIGSDSFTFQVSNGSNTSSAATISITVVGTPTANSQSVAVAFNTAKAVTLTGSDPNSPPRSLTYAVVTGPAHGTLSGTAPNLTYTPAAGYHGADSFQFTVSNGVNTSSPAIVSVTVNPVFLAALTFTTPVPGGTVEAGTVTLSGVSPADVVVGLSSSNSSVIRIFRAVIVPAGSSSATFAIDTYRSHVTKTVTVQAALDQVTLTKDLTITGR